MKLRFFLRAAVGMEVFCMCGIVGYVGARSAQQVLLDGLEKLEYRGYDSAGVALTQRDGIRVVKSKGRLATLRTKLEALALPESGCGIGHTRWATHGETQRCVQPSALHPACEHRAQRHH